MSPILDPLDKAEWRVREGLSWEVRDLIQRYHYSKDYAGTGTNHVLVPAETWWAGPAWGAAVWQAAVFGINRYGCLPLQLSRLVLRPDAPKNSASFLLRHSMSLLDRAKWPVLLTYADSGQGHTGAIYKATGWVSDGVGGGWNYYEPSTGRQLSSLQGGRFIECPEGWEARRTVKHRFVHRAVAASSDAADFQSDEGGSQPTLLLQLGLDVPA
jgi:hypothetical protein